MSSASDNVPWEIDAQAVRQLLQEGADFLFLDCRETDEYQTAHIDGARLLPMSELAQRVGELAAESDRRIVVHCHHGGRSLRVARWLRSQGFGQTQSMAGGIDAWSLTIDPSIPRY